MTNRHWGGLSGALVPSFEFDEKSKSDITNEISKLAIPHDVISLFLDDLKQPIQVDFIRRDGNKDIDVKKTTVSKLTKVVNGLQKAIDALNSLDSTTQELFSDYVYLAEKGLFQTTSIDSMHSDPTEKLEIVLKAAKHQLQKLNRGSTPFSRTV